MAKGRSHVCGLNEVHTREPILDLVDNIVRRKIKKIDKLYIERMLQEGEASTTIVSPNIAKQILGVKRTVVEAICKPIEHKAEEIRVTFGDRPGAKFDYEAIMLWFPNSQACENKEECMMCDPFKKYRKRRVEIQNPLTIDGEDVGFCKISNKES